MGLACFFPYVGWRQSVHTRARRQRHNNKIQQKTLLFLRRKRKDSFRDDKNKRKMAVLFVDHADRVGLLDMPIELLAKVMAPLSVRDVASFEGVCASTQDLARCDRLWARLYKRDFGRTGPPDEHVDAAMYGRGFRWLYMIEVARKRKRPISLCNGRYIHVAPAPDGSTCESGEWTVLFDEASNAAPRLVMDGYATATYLPKATANAKKVLSKVDENVRTKEGIWRAGSFVGPGRLVCHTGTWTRADRYSASGACGQGESHFVGGDRYVGHFADGQRHGFGTYRRVRNNECLVGEWSSGSRRGRCVATGVTCSNKAYAGQCSEGVYKGAGIMRDLDGTVHQSVFDIANTTSVYAITRRPLQASDNAAVVTTRTIYSDTDNGAWRTDTIDAERAWTRTDARDAVRIALPGSGNVAIGGPAYMILTAVGDGDGDPRLAGRRIWGHAWTKAPDTERSPLAALPADPRSSDARVWAAYLDSPQCLVKGDVAKKCRAHLLSAAAEAGVSLDWRSAEDDRDPAALGLGLPFGRVLDMADVPSRQETEMPPTTATDDSPKQAATKNEKDVSVRCFLSGTIVPAAECDFLSSGRLYARDRLDGWFLFGGPHRSADPETGDELPCAGRKWRLPWHAWMAHVSPHLLAWAVRDAAMRYPNVSPGTIIKEHVRATVALAMGVIDKRRATVDPYDVLASQQTFGTSGVSDARILVDLDGLVLAHVELRHPLWEPRGPWRLGTPADPPHDPTVQPFESTDRDPAPTAYLFSHGVVNVDLKAASFVASRLTSVYFFGQHLGGASFAGATLTACVFVGCHFQQTAFFGASIGNCVFYDCKVVDGAHPNGHEVAGKDILERIRSGGIL
nr:F-box domain protein [Pandoravirus massiliensis]